MSIPRNTPTHIQECPILQYASGHTQARALNIMGARFTGLIGFHSEIGCDAELDAVMTEAKVGQIEIRHSREGGSPAVVRHWWIGEKIDVFPITAGPVATTIGGCLVGGHAQRTAEAGIGLSWPTGGKSRMAVRGLLTLPNGTFVLVQLAVRSTMTGHLLTALLDHERVCVAADGLIDREKHADPVAYHELALALQASKEEVSAGKEETAQIVPLISGHPKEITAKYIRSIWRSSTLQKAAVAAWPAILAWAAGYRSGETNGDSHID